MAAGEAGRKPVPELYYNVPLNALQHSTRHQIGLHLNLINEIRFNDWRRVAEQIGLGVLEIQNMVQSSSNATEAVLIRATQKKYTVGKFMEILIDMERDDVIEDCQQMIEDNVNTYRPLQVAEVSSDSRAPLTFGELNTGEVEFFDAFLSYHIEDYEFVKTLVDKLEKELGFKLCIPDRDFCIGIVENEATAELIKRRCKRAIIVLSTSYIGSADLKAKLKWQLQIAQSLAPVADSMHKLVPMIIDSVIRNPEDVPDILLPYNICDYSRPAVREWFWERVEQSLAAPTNRDEFYKGPAGRLGKNARRADNEGGPRPRTNTEPANMHSEDFHNISTVSRTQRTESDSGQTTSTGRSQFYRPAPSSIDSPKRKKQWPWTRKD